MNTCTNEILSDKSNQNPVRITSKRPGGLRNDFIIAGTILSAITAIRYILYRCSYYYGLTGLHHFYNASQFLVLFACALIFCLLLLLVAHLLWTIPQKYFRRLYIRFLLLVLMAFTAYSGIKWSWGWSPREALRTGFLLRMQQKADIQAIRQWWASASDQYDVIEYIDKTDWPKAIKDLNPDYIQVGRKSALPKYVSLWWTSFGYDFWGLDVGPETMVCPPPKRDKIEQEECIPLVDGAYVFFLSFD